MEVYVDEMMVNFNEAESYARDLEEVFAQIQKHNMRLNPGKCVRSRRGKILRVYALP